jgi:hypothetical protein
MPAAARIASQAPDGRGGRRRAFPSADVRAREILIRGCVPATAHPIKAKEAPAFHVTVEGEPRALHPILRDDIYKITAEFDEALLPRQAAAGHYGVPGMRERAELMGATLTIWSTHGAGTAVELCIPLGGAYLKTRERRWFSRAFAGPG